jgi:hypothetical protein
LGIPIDLSLAFHTDAGIVRGDSVIGTLSIYSVEDFDSALVFPDGVSRMANRDLADILQTQIVDDIRAKWDPQWNRRQLYNRQYGESYRPNVPAALIELLSHQNFNDMRFGNDPRFRADVSRAFYKGIQILPDKIKRHVLNRWRLYFQIDCRSESERCNGAAIRSVETDADTAICVPPQRCGGFDKAFLSMSLCDYQ